MSNADTFKKVSARLWRQDKTTPSRGDRYVLLDAARDERIYPKLAAASGLEGICLFRGEQAEQLAGVAPYVVKLGRDDPFTRWVLDDGWGNSWGIFFGSSAPLKDLRLHFRNCLTVEDEQGERVFFRFYDPRVFRVFLPTCDAGQLDILFGPVQCYWAEGENGSTLIEYTRTGEALGQETVAIDRL